MSIQLVSHKCTYFGYTGSDMLSRLLQWPEPTGIGCMAADSDLAVMHQVQSVSPGRLPTAMHVCSSLYWVATMAVPGSKMSQVTAPSPSTGAASPPWTVQDPLLQQKPGEIMCSSWAEVMAANGSTLCSGLHLLVRVSIKYWLRRKRCRAALLNSRPLPCTTNQAAAAMLLCSSCVYLPVHK